MSRVEVRFVVLTDPYDEAEHWTPISRVSPEDAVALWGRAARFTCCTFSAGFEVLVDGASWNKDGQDELQMAETWLDALMRLLQGYTRAGVWAWEESDMTLSRRGDIVDALDVHHAGSIVTPHTTFPLPDLVHAFADAAEEAETWLQAVHTAALTAGRDDLATGLAGQRHRSWADVARDLRRGISRPLPPPPPDDPGPLPEPWLAAKMMDLSGLRGIDPDLQVDGEPILHLAIRQGWVDGVEALLALGADVQSTGPHGFTALQQAVRSARRDTPRPVVAALLAYGAEVDPIAAVLLDDPGGLRAATARGEISRETVNWWTFSALGRDVIDPAWLAALREAVSAGTPAHGIKHGLGGWYETPLEAAQGRGRDDVVAILSGLDAAG